MGPQPATARRGHDDALREARDPDVIESPWSPPGCYMVQEGRIIEVMVSPR